MDIHWTMAVAGLAAFVGVLGVSAVMLMLVQRLTEIRVRQEEMASDIQELKESQHAFWTALFSRGKVAAVNKGLGKMQSPFVITQAARAMFPERLVDDLKGLYESVQKPIEDHALAMLIERHTDLRDRIIHDVCLKNGVDTFECLAIAVEIAKSSEVLSV